MVIKSKTIFIGGFVFCLICFLLLAMPISQAEDEEKKPSHPYDVYDHDMHTQIFEGSSVPCGLCHIHPQSYEKRELVHSTGCHRCHNSPNPIIDVKLKCVACHQNAIPKPKSHTDDWMEKHPPSARKNADECMQCHYTGMSCFDCHEANKTVKPKKKQAPHPFNFYDHKMHFDFFQSANVPCKTCHSDPNSFSDRKKVNRLGCHKCHSDPKPIISATNKCTTCHIGGSPKPPSHKVDWKKKHQVYAKQNRKECLQCHTNQMFCIDCHKKRDTIEQRGHRRNFRFFHSVEARANPRKCEACHTVTYCQECHSGRGTSKR